MSGQIDIITLGCSKNLVDSESLQRMFLKEGYRCVLDADRVTGDVVVINTCGFIEDAKQESIDTILQFSKAKEEGQIERLYVMGCLSQRYKEELETEIPAVDKYYGKFDYKGLVEELRKVRPCEERNGDVQKTAARLNRNTIYSPATCYIKISEGCNRQCAYCAIPIITGRHTSRPMQEILDEVREKVSEGVREFNIIAQELTYYGKDTEGRRTIAELISRMADIKGVKWIRLHYAYPAQFPMELLDVMRKKKNVCKYLDIALQHVSTSVLERMRRHTTKEETMDIVKRLREAVPGITLRTTLMVGFPGETDEEFQELVDFVKWARFERMGAFAYSEEEGTYSAEHYQDDVPAEVKQQRLDKLMRVQQRISQELMQERVGKTVEVIIDRKEGEWYVGRTEDASPEIDPEVLIPAADRRLRRGCFYKVRITDAEEFDLYGNVI
ncbi:MAG: 30S ribosomal protein S12 methylthiotransferase RimO [Prevotella sp.]|nr:30S ribosomal protein S12 methylthiotransferase RimO [Prevotella sp.]